jgi:hypothetical protein
MSRLNGWLQKLVGKDAPFERVAERKKKAPNISINSQSSAVK